MLTMSKHKYVKRQDKTSPRVRDLHSKNSLKLFVPTEVLRETDMPKSVTNLNVSNIISAASSTVSSIPFILDQGGVGTCVANSTAYMVYSSLGNVSRRPVGSDLTVSPNIMSTCALQYAENMIFNGFNPGFISGNPVLVNMGLDNTNYDSLFEEGAWFSIAAHGLMSMYIPPESIWQRPKSYITSIPNFFSPVKNTNPLLASVFTPSTNGKYSLRSATLYSANYGSYTVTNTSFNTSSYFLSSTIMSNLVQMWMREVIPLIDDDNTSLRQRNLLSYMNSTLVSGKPLGISFLVESAFENVGSDGLYLPSSSNIDPNEILGGHAVTIVGTMLGSTWRNRFPFSPNLSSVSNSEWLFIVYNSWGTSWGDNGIFYLKVTDFFNTTLQEDNPDYIDTLFNQAVLVITAASK